MKKNEIVIYCWEEEQSWEKRIHIGQAGQFLETSKKLYIIYGALDERLQDSHRSPR